jgi:hypothetical protein
MKFQKPRRDRASRIFTGILQPWSADDQFGRSRPRNSGTVRAFSASFGWNILVNQFDFGSFPGVGEYFGDLGSG